MGRRYLVLDRAMNLLVQVVNSRKVAFDDRNRLSLRCLVLFLYKCLWGTLREVASPLMMSLFELLCVYKQSIQGPFLSHNLGPLLFLV